AALHLSVEHEFAVSPLPVPDLTQLPALADLAHVATVRLFVDRAQAVKADFQLTEANARAIAEICVRLDGLPLAIKLAAARIKLLPPQALLKRLSHRLEVLTGGVQDLPARQQTLRNTLQWSYDLLTAEEQRLFRQISVFVRGWTLEAVEAVAKTAQEKSRDGFSVLDGVASLLDKSLLVQLGYEGQEEPRLMMLATIREYGLECLAAQGEMEATRRAHADYYLELAQQAEKELGGTQQAVWLEQLEQEHENLRAALNWFLERGEATPALRLCAAIWWFWSVRGHVSEGRNFLERALNVGVSLADTQVATVVRAKALNAAGMLALNQDDYDAGEALCGESLALFRQLGDKQGMALTLYRLGLLAWWKCHYTAARSQEEEALALYRELGDKGGAADPLLILSDLALVQGNYAGARSLAEESLALFREVGDRWGLAYALLHLARVIFAQGDATRAQTLVQECLAISRELGYKEGIAESFGLLGQFALQQGDTALAHSLLAESQLRFRAVGDRRGTARSLCLLANVIAAQGDNTTARALYEESLALLRALGDNEYIALCLEGLGAAIAASGNVGTLPRGQGVGGPRFIVGPRGGAEGPGALADARSAVRLWGMAEALREANGISMLPVYRPDYEHIVATARARLGEKAFAAEWAEGRTMTPEVGTELASALLVALEHVTNPEPVSTTLEPPTASSPALASVTTYPNDLTPREVEVLRLLAQGLTSAQIAEQLVIGLVTVNSHVRSIYSKLGVSSRSAATRFAIEHHLL
ncbi:MAG TPA: tetratricopeptide repeat protein, partial [Ktedonobacteraceae bacterium]|nr:tetratricopeptide repeat protein [Ktedonobacteraceae bacterium]